MKLVLLADYADCIIDMRYASSRNIMRKPLTANDKPQLQPQVAKQLTSIVHNLSTAQLQLVVWDAYRDPSIQEKLIVIANDERYARKNSNHCQGLAIDVTLADSNSNLLDMGTDHDDFSSKAHVAFTGLTKEQLNNRELLRSVMERGGHFKQWPYEWWHFDYIN